ncbi:E3 ISG15--protein ligase HERC5 [Tamandua tetradactyla]|uniref:E3 ISG15--protein ligase HERC5 n=1 Tax=Tamandua tetradactyla TaxID=48850 RepID=UPI004053FA2F
MLFEGHSVWEFFLVPIVPPETPSPSCQSLPATCLFSWPLKPVSLSVYFFSFLFRFRFLTKKNHFRFLTELSAPSANSALGASLLGRGADREAAAATSAASQCSPRRPGGTGRAQVLLIAPCSIFFVASCSSVSPEGPGTGGESVSAMGPKLRRRSRDRAHGAPKPDPGTSMARPSAELWLFPSPAGLRSALPRRLEATRQICCARGRLAVLERGGAGVEVHQLPPGCGGASKSEYIKLKNKMKIHSVDQGAKHMLILSSNGKTFEYNYTTEHARVQHVLQEKNIIQITCGDYHSLALSKGGELFAWGQNVHGQLGVGRIFVSTSTPQIVERLSGVPLVQISAGEAHSMALSMSGNIYSWGKNDFGQLGLGHTNNEDSPTLIEELDNQKVEFLTCGGSHTALLTEDGLAYTFGAGKYGQLGHNSTQNELRPRLVTELVGNRVTQIACGRWHTLAYVSALGKVFAFGRGDEGQLGNGGTHDQLIPLLMKLPSNEELKFENHTSEKELIMIAGGNQSILLWMEKENSYVNLRRKIPTLSERAIKRWIADVGTKQWQNTQREIREIFSYPACLTGSFLEKRVTTETMSIHVDLIKARNIFKELTQEDRITSLITACFRDNLLRNLPFSSPYQEALEVFFLLPECSVMHDSSNWESLVVPFAEAVCKMSGQASGVLEKHWASLQESTFSELVQMLKGAIISQMKDWSNNPEKFMHLKALLEMLKKLHRVNQVKRYLPENTFIINELSDWFNFYGEALRSSLAKLDTSVVFPGPILFRCFPFIFNVLSKIKLLYADAFLKKLGGPFMNFLGTVEQRWSELPFLPTYNLKVRRSDLVEDVLNQLNQSEDEDLNKQLSVSFTGEIGDSIGGVRAEFFHCMFEEMTQPEYGMFLYPEEAACMWFPVRPKFEKKRYFLFGVLCGLSLSNYTCANIPFPLALFKKLLDQPPSLEDLKELSPVLGMSMQTLLDDESDDFGEVFYIHFNVHWDKNDVDLIPNGSCITVNQINKRDYVSKCIDYIFNISVKTVYEEFQRGFYRVCNKEIIELFQPEELKEVITGNTDYDWEAFEKNACYKDGYDSDHPTIIMFWKAFHKLSLEEKKKFLMFLRGTDRMQIKVLKNMKITFCCPENVNENDPIRSQTCFSILLLPKYSTMKRMEKALQVSIHNSRGFS